MRLAEIIALLVKLGPIATKAWPYIQQIIDAMSNILALLNAPSSAGKPDPQAVAQFVAAGATQEQAESACTTINAFEQYAV